MTVLVPSASRFSEGFRCSLGWQFLTLVACVAFGEQKCYLVGRDRSKTHFRVLKIDRSETSELNISEDPVVYTQIECNNLLQRVAQGNLATGGMTKVTKAYGIVGVCPFFAPISASMFVH